MQTVLAPPSLRMDYKLVNVLNVFVSTKRASETLVTLVTLSALCK